MSNPASPHPVRTSHLVAGFAAIYFIWGSTYLGIKFAVETLPPFLMAGWRFVLAGIVLYALRRWRGVEAPTRAQWLRGAWTGSLLLVGGNGLVTWGQQTVPSGKAALIVATTPMWMVLFGWLLYRGERPSLRVWVGMAAGFVGAAMLIKPAGHSAAGSVAGLIALVASPFCWSVGSLESRRLRPAEDTLLTSAMQMLTGGAVLLAMGSLFGEWPVLFAREVSKRSLLAFAYLSIVGGLIGFSVYAWLLRVASPMAVTTYAYVNPLVAVLLGWLIAHETIDFGIIAAGGLILGAVILITLPRDEPSKSDRPRRWLFWGRRPIQSLHRGEEVGCVLQRGNADASDELRRPGRDASLRDAR